MIAHNNACLLLEVRYIFQVFDQRIIYDWVGFLQVRWGLNIYGDFIIILFCSIGVLMLTCLDGWLEHTCISKEVFTSETNRILYAKHSTMRQNYFIETITRMPLKCFFCIFIIGSNPKSIIFSTINTICDVLLYCGIANLQKILVCYSSYIN